MRVPRPRIAIALGAALLAAGCGGAHHVTIDVTPREATYDMPFDIRIAGLRPHEIGTVHVAGRSADGALWSGTLDVRADASGSAALHGVYVLGRLHHPHSSVAYPRRLTFSIEGAQVAARRGPWSTVPAATELPARVGFYGEWYRPPHTSHHSAILIFGGSEGGLLGSQLPELLAAHGYPVLNVAYFDAPGVPPQLVRIRLEYFERALRWLAVQPAVDPRRIVTFGISRGGELSLILASTFPQLVDAAVGYVPYWRAVESPAVPGAPAWTYRGRPVLGTISVWRIRGPVFVAGGGDDELWPSGLAIDVIRRELRRHGRHDFVALEYPHAGHLLGLTVPFGTVNLSTGSYGVMSSQYGPLVLGGSARADEAAREDAWPKLLRFLGAL